MTLVGHLNLDGLRIRAMNRPPMRWEPRLFPAPIALDAARLAGLVLMVSAAACQSYVFDPVVSEKVKQARVVLAAATPVPADIMFVVDNSGSMDNKQDNLRRNFSAFINQIAGAGGDYQIAVVTTDLDFRGGERGGVLVQSFAQMPPYNLLSRSDTMCRSVSIDHGCFRGDDAAKRIIRSSVLSKDEQITTFQANAQVGSCGSGIEQGLGAMREALRKTGPGGCNQGFLRDGANLVVIVLSDEDDTDDTPLQQYVNDIRQFKDYSKVRFAMITASVDGTANDCSIAQGGTCGRSVCANKPPEGSGARCTTDGMCPGPSPQYPQGQACDGGRCQNRALLNWDDAFCGWCSLFEAPDCCTALRLNNPRKGEGGRYVSFAQMMEARTVQDVPSIPVSRCRAAPGTPAACLVDTICQDNYSTTLSRIARELVISNQYNLSPPTTYAPGVKVRVKGGRFGDAGTELVYGRDFQVSPDGSSLTISAMDKTPREGETIEILYILPNE